MRKMEQGTKALIMLRDAILSGRIEAGQRLLELSMVERLNISRTPIRFALERLADEGLIEKLGGGYVVRTFSRQEIRDAIHVRGLIEGLAVRMAAERGPLPEPLREARQCITDLDVLIAKQSSKKVDIEGYLSINQRFHESIIAMADSFIITRMLNNICTLPFASPNSFVMAQRQVGDLREVIFTSQLHHRTMLEAIEQGEGARAESIAREHAELSLTAMRKTLESPQLIDETSGLELLKATVVDVAETSDA
jgi:GntR family transcriptional regulator, vanillate catabolism transcriptional regulator